MNYLFKCLYDFVLMYLLFYIIYSVFVNKKRKVYSEVKKMDEIKYFIARYQLDMRKTDYLSLLKTMTRVNCFILSFTTVVVTRIDGFMLSILVGFAVIMILIYSLYEIVGRYYQRKEKIKNV